MKIYGQMPLQLFRETHPPCSNSMLTSFCIRIVPVLPNLTAPAIIIGLQRPWGIALSEGEKIIVAENGSHCILIISSNGEKISYGSKSSAPSQLNCPKGVAVDVQGSILVSDYRNSRVLKLSPTGKLLQTVGTKRNGPLRFYCTRGIAV